MERRARRIIGEVSERQRGVVALAQLLDLGLTRSSANHAVQSGLLIPVATAVYRVVGAPQTLAMATMAASLATDGRASHNAAARLLRLGTLGGVVPIHMTVDGGRQHPRVHRIDVADGERAFFGVTVHRHRDLGEPTLVIDGVPCTDGARTLIDLAGMLETDQLADALDRARDLGLVSVDALARRFALIGGRGRPGTPKIRKVLEQAPRRPLQSKLERIAARMIERSGLPQPVRQYTIADVPGPYRLDFAWPGLLAAWETEGFEWHGTRARWKQDRLRVARIEHSGWRHMVATWDDVVLRPTETIERLSLMLRERRALADARALDQSIVRCVRSGVHNGQ